MPGRKPVHAPGMMIRTRYPKAVRDQLARIRKALEAGKIPWSTAVKFADEAKRGRES